MTIAMAHALGNQAPMTAWSTVSKYHLGLHDNMNLLPHTHIAATGCSCTHDSNDFTATNHHMSHWIKPWQHDLLPHTLSNHVPLSLLPTSTNNWPHNNNNLTVLWNLHPQTAAWLLGMVYLYDTLLSRLDSLINRPRLRSKQFTNILLHSLCHEVQRFSAYVLLLPTVRPMLPA